MSQNNQGKIYILGGKRTAFGKFGGSLTTQSPVDLGVLAGKAALEQTGVKPESVDQVILGNVVPSSTDTMYGGRHMALRMGCKEETPGLVVNRLCGSGIQSLIDGIQNISCGRAEVVVAAGSENMSMIPHLTYGARFGTKYGPLQSVDMLLDALTDKYACLPMGITAENLAEKYEISREDCDKFALNSHQKATAAYEKNNFDFELTPVELKKGNLIKDEHLRVDASLDQMTKLRPNFKKDGVVTAANASGIVDGAAAVVLASEAYVEKNGLTPLCEVVDYSFVGVDPKIMGIGPVPAIQQLLERNALNLDKIDLVEINEAFAAQTIACMKELSLPEEKLNIWGGAIALGHPLGASGTRITLSLASQLKALGKDMGIASACIGGGQGIGILIKRVS